MSPADLPPTDVHPTAPPEQAALVWSALAETGTVFLDAARQGAHRSRSLLFRRPSRLITARQPEQVLQALAELEAALAAGCWCAGFLSYEAGYGLVGLPTPWLPEEPLLWFGVYPEPPTALAAVNLPAQHADEFPLALSGFMPKQDYLRSLEAIFEAIRSGNTYQVNFTDAVQFGWPHDPRELFAAVRQRQRVHFGAFCQGGEWSVQSFSPELFFERHGPRITVEPMKGTAPRHADPARDEQLRQELATSDKNRAENIMIVDLLRNDLGRICETGSVQVPALLETQPLETVWQMTSTITGTLREPLSLTEFVTALFPSGSITGAPKRSTMQHIAALERGPRGVYTGGLGYFAPHGEAVLNVAIRTVFLREGHGRMGIGSGVTICSDAADEYAECLLKARFLGEHHAESE